MEVNKDIIDSFNQKKTLSPDIFDISGDNFVLNKKVREKLIRIATDFVGTLKISSVEIDDILIVGSIVNYNWSRYSDLDLHIVLDYSQLSNNDEVNDEFLKTKKKDFNTKYSIKINGFDLEIGTQETNEELESNGCYSVLYNKWIKEPSKEKYSIDKKVLLNKYKQFLSAFSEIKSEKNLKIRLEKISKIKDIIAKYRQSGLDENGEFSIENLVFKYMRRTGFMNQLDRLKILTVNRLSSIK